MPDSVAGDSGAGVNARIITGDCLDAMRRLADEGVRVDAMVTDPPYHLTSIVKRFGSETAAPAKGGVYARSSKGFMGKTWDGGDIAMRPETWGLAAALMKPGAHLVAFGGSRTFHRVACAIEDAGFEIRDTIMWLYGSGFNKIGMLKNRHPELWCKCDDEQNPEHDLRSLHEADLSAAVLPANKQGEVLFACVPQQGPSEYRPPRAEPETSTREQPGLGGRALCGAGQGLCDGAAALASEGEEKRLRLRAHPGSGEDARETAESGRGSAPHQPGSSGQSAGESEGLREPHRTLDDGALRDGGRCPRCGGISRAFDGFGGSLKPAHEPIILARKPLIGTVAANILAHGTGALNIDGCRVETSEALGRFNNAKPAEHCVNDSDPAAKHLGRMQQTAALIDNSRGLGRWPANLCHDGSPEVLEAFARFGERGAAAPVLCQAGTHPNIYQPAKGYQGDGSTFYGDTGTAARFFYAAKASAADRAGSKHPTVKPLSLMRWLCRLVTPPGGLILDPFAGSGTTLQAAVELGFRAIGIEREAEYAADIERRMTGVAPLPVDMFGEVAA